MAYTDIDKPSDYFNTILWTGASNTAGRSFTGVGFQPNLVWSKIRDDTYHHNWFDSVRGAGSDKEINSDTSGAEGSGDTDGYGFISSFDTDGFTSAPGTASGGRNLEYNQNGNTFVAWNWKAGSGTSTNTAGNGPDTTINVNQTAGFSIVTWTGNGDAHTFGHGLGANADVVIVKNRGSGSSSAWYVNHISVANTKTLFLNTTAAETTNGIWGNSAPDSTTFKFDTDNTDNFVAYCFAAKKGYSKFGSYTGNGNADGTFVYTGFKPAFVIVKLTSGSGEHWYIQDATRDTFNPSAKRIKANASDAELDNTAFNIDFLSNGMKMRNTNAGHNGSGSTYIYMAFASNPFTTSTGVPATAR